MGDQQAEIDGSLVKQRGVVDGLKEQLALVESGEAIQQTDGAKELSPPASRVGIPEEHSRINTLHAQAAFRSMYPDHPDLPDIEASVARLAHREWMEMATEQLQDASPDDSGFVEGWLPIAGAWQLVGNDAEAREALPRMAHVERIIESTIDLCQHESFDPSFSKQLIDNAAKTCEQVASTSKRSRYFANLSGLAMALANDGRWKKTIEQAKRILAKDPAFRSDAWEAIATARFKDEREPREQLLEWTGSLAQA